MPSLSHMSSHFVPNGTLQLGLVPGLEVRLAGQVWGAARPRAPSARSVLVSVDRGPCREGPALRIGSCQAPLGVSRRDSVLHVGGCHQLMTTAEISKGREGV